MHPELGPYSKVLTPQQRGDSFNLLESVFRQGSEAESDYNSVIPERDTQGFSLFNPLPGVFQERIFSYAGILCLSDHDRLMFRDHLTAYDRAAGAETVVAAMTEYKKEFPDEMVIEVVAQGLDLFNEITGFDTAGVSEEDLASLLPKSTLPPAVDFMFYLLEIRKDYLFMRENQDMHMGYGIAIGTNYSNEIKKRLLHYGLELAKVSSASAPGNPIFIGNANPHVFSEHEIKLAFRALTQYDLDHEVQGGNK